MKTSSCFRNASFFLPIADHFFAHHFFAHILRTCAHPPPFLFIFSPDDNWFSVVEPPNPGANNCRLSDQKRDPRNVHRICCSLDELGGRISRLRYCFSRGDLKCLLLYSRPQASLVRAVCLRIQQDNAYHFQVRCSYNSFYSHVTVQYVMYHHTTLSHHKFI